MIDASQFNAFLAALARVLPQSGAFTAAQRKGIEAFWIYFALKKYAFDAQFAYVLATVWHETACTMQPIEEYGKGKGKKYGKRLKMSGEPYSDYPHIYFGRGFVQLTWYENYGKMGEELGLDLLATPELALDLVKAVEICVEGMRKGLFSGKKLSDYFTEKESKPIAARAIVNGKDKAKLIASYHAKIAVALIQAQNT